MDGYQVRSPRDGEWPLLETLEAAADRVFEPIGFGPLPPPAPAASYADADCVLVVGDPPVGLARLGLVDGTAYLAQLSVHPDHSGQGVGSALLAAACAWAAAAGHRELALTTYAEIPWNGPFYARRGFRPIAEPGPQMRELRLREAEMGLDALGPRVAMSRAL